MSYTKQTWATGDTITAAKLNHMEDGIAGGGALIVTVTTTEGTDDLVMDKTAQEIYDALTSGTPVFCSRSDGTPTTSYESSTHFDIITDIYGYNYDANLKVIVIKSLRGVNFAAYPSVAIFQAEGLADYPLFIGTVLPKDESLKLALEY